MKDQIEEHINSAEAPSQEAEPERLISTGSTILDLEISGGIYPGGGIPPGILVEVFGPSQTGKSVLLSEMAGNIQHAGGDVLFADPESRLNDQFAKLFGLDVRYVDYIIPNTVTELFKELRAWKPANAKHDAVPPETINGIFADSIAALSTDLEMEKEDGDKYGMRRAKELSEELRKTCRLIKDRDYLMVCSNQVRINVAAGPYGQKYTTPGGMAMEFYSSLRLRLAKLKELKRKGTVYGKAKERPEGVETVVKIAKSSVWRPSGQAVITILWDYGIDDVRDNLQYIKSTKGDTVYKLGDTKLGKSLKGAIRDIEEDGLESELRESVINLWLEVEESFKIGRKEKKRR